MVQGQEKEPQACVGGCNLKTVPLPVTPPSYVVPYNAPSGPIVTLARGLAGPFPDRPKFRKGLSSQSDPDGVSWKTDPLLPPPAPEPLVVP
jgi:hypothetical protein